MSGAVMRGVELVGVEINGEVENLAINMGRHRDPGQRRTLDRRYPDRAKMRPTDPAGFREAWDVIDRLGKTPPSEPDRLTSHQAWRTRLGAY